MFPEDPKDPELGAEAEELLTHWPLDDKSPAEWEDLALRIDARIKITEVGSTPDYLLEAPLLEEQDLLRRSHPRMKRPSEGSLAALAKASLVKDSSPDAVQLEAEREALARSLLSLAVKARTEPQNTAAPYSTKERSDSSASLSELVNGGPAMQFLATRQTTAAVHDELPRVAGSDAEAPTPNAVAASSPKGSRERGSMWFGIAFGLLGMAAAGVMYVASPEQPALDEGATLAAQPVAAPAKAELPEPAPKPAAPAPAAGDLLKLEEVPLAEAAPARLAALPEETALPDDTALPKDRAAAVRPGARAPAAAAAPAAAPGAEQPAAVAPPAGPSEPGMVMADSRGTLPDHPSTGAVQAAVGMVMGAARACVAGQSDASRATLNFGSDGRVQSVTIAGPAQATSAEPCLRNALSGARVQPFARAGYSVTLTVRPQ